MDRATTAFGLFDWLVAGADLFLEKSTVGHG
jgi:hypothetical protein